MNYKVLRRKYSTRLLTKPWDEQDKKELRQSAVLSVSIFEFPFSGVWGWGDGNFVGSCGS